MARLDTDEQTFQDITPWWRRRGDVHKEWFKHAIECIEGDGRRIKLDNMRKVFEGERVDGPGESDLKVARNAGLAVYAKMVRSQPATLVLTTGGSVSLQQRGRALTDWLAGFRKKMGTNALTKLALHDSLTDGSGGVHTFRDHRTGEMRQETVWVGDCGLEPLELEHRCPKTLYRVRVIDRNVAKALWSSKAGALSRAGFGLSDKDPARSWGKDAVDLITLVEAWHKGESGVPGRHAIMADTCTLRNERWEGKDWPIRFMHWTTARKRYFGIGLVESMMKPQENVDRISDTVLEHAEKGGGKWMLHEDGGVTEEQITNTPGETLRWRGEQHMQPRYEAPAVVATDYRMLQADYIDRLYQLNGVSQFGASSLKPAGVEAAAAMRTLNETEDQYWFPQHSEYEEFCTGVDRDMIAVAEEIADAEGPETDKLKALGIHSRGGRTMLRHLQYADARFDADSMLLQTFPVAKLSQSPAGRIQDVRELVELQIPEDKGDVLELLGYPDTRRFESLESAGRRLVQLQVERALLGEPQQVDPAAIPLEYAQRHARQQLALARLEGSEDDLEELQSYVDGVDSELEKLQAQTQPPMPGPAPGPVPGVPGGAPAGPPLAPVPPAA